MLRIKWIGPVLFALLLGVMLTAIWIGSPAQAAGPRCYVDRTATGLATGASWTDAYTTVQDALADGGCTEIWVAKGVYYPDEGGGQKDDNRAASFKLTRGMALYGGFAGAETARDQRDPAAHVTVLSGDIGQDDVTDAQGVVTDTANIQGGNAYHVVQATNVLSDTVLDGFTITGGNADGPVSFSRGGGAYNVKSSPTLANLVLSGNKAVYGGGIWNEGQSNPSMEHVTLSGNLATADGGGIYNNGSSPSLTHVVFAGNHANGSGGGVHNNDNSDPQFNQVSFTGNQAQIRGGGMFNLSNRPVLSVVTFTLNTAGHGAGMYNESDAAPALTEVAFIANEASGHGGGMYNSNSRPTVLNTAFLTNTAQFGGGMYNDMRSRASLTNVTFSGNRAGDGGGFYNFDHSVATLTNVTFSGNGNGPGSLGGGIRNISGVLTLINVVVANSQGGDCYNNTSASLDPASAHNLMEDDGASACGLTNGDNGNIIGLDARLGPLTDYGGPGRQAHPLLPGSPAIDAGTDEGCPATDQRGVARPAGGACDIGAFEYTGSSASAPIYLPVVVNGR